ncbi:hypothetical protein ES707_16499 [subsurface metagenome]
MTTGRAVLSARLEPRYIQTLDEVAKARKITRSELLRELATNAAAFYDFILAEKERHQAEKIELNGNLTQFVLNHNPEVPADMLHLLSEVLEHAAEIKESQSSGS